MANLFMMAAAAHEAAEPAAFGVLPAPWIVAAAMAVLLIVALVLKVPAAAAKGLDASIAEIKKQLDEAKALRAEAEKLRADYTARVAGAEKEALQLVEHAKTEAAARKDGFGQDRGQRARGCGRVARERGAGGGCGGGQLDCQPIWRGP